MASRMGRRLSPRVLFVNLQFQRTRPDNHGDQRSGTTTRFRKKWAQVDYPPEDRGGPVNWV